MFFFCLSFSAKNVIYESNRPKKFLLTLYFICKYKSDNIMASPMTSTLYRQSAALQSNGLYVATPPKHYAMGGVQSASERNRLMELLRAPNILTSPTLEPSSKGLLNGPGQNNCFLNCAVQVSFRTTYFE